jgi:cobalamin-dependent methionine synthase I
MMERKVDEREEEAYTDSNETMNKIIADGSMTLKGAVGLFAANRSEDGEDAHNKSTRPLLNWRGGRWN